MFQFAGFPPVCLCIQHTVMEVSSIGFPHSDICGSLPVCGSPQLFAAYHVFHRPLVPRHPPRALFCLTVSCSLSDSFRNRPAFLFSRLAWRYFEFLVLVSKFLRCLCFSTLFLVCLVISRFANSRYKWIPLHWIPSGDSTTLPSSRFWFSVFGFQGTNS